MSQHDERRDQGSPRFTRVNREDSGYRYQEQGSKWRKKAWTEEQDDYLIKLVAKYGPQKWTVIAENLPGRVGKQCRERWHNHLNPDINKTEWSEQEEWLLFLLHKKMGNQWAHFTKQLKGRTDNAIKNHWNSIMKKRSHQYLERYKRIKNTIQTSKESHLIDIDTFLIEKIGEQLGLQQFQQWEKDYQKLNKREGPIKSTSTIIQKQQSVMSMDLQKTAKKKVQTQTSEKRQETTVRQKKANPYSFAPNFNTRLSQLSLFGPQSRQNIASAFSLLDEPDDPVVLEPLPSFNDFSLSINCFEQEKQGGEGKQSLHQKIDDGEFPPVLLSSRQSLSRMRRKEVSLLKHQ